jgi:large subunit ribosomal protein L24
MKSAFKTGDIVKILSGVEKGKSGKVLKVDRKKDLVLVEGINQKTHFTKKSDKNPNGGMIKREAYMHCCKVMKSADAAPKSDKKKETKK